jgi:cob(I)alamin adenosyltransferase
MKIYKDSEETNLVDGKMKKTSLRAEAIGNVDEIQALTGLARSTSSSEVNPILKDIQEDLWSIGADLAGAKKLVTEKNVKKLEDMIKKIEEELTPLTNFILSGGTETAAALEICRTVTRRAERSILRLKETEEVNNEVFRYINRLSDVFFALSRLENKRANIDEDKWVSKP